MLYDPRKTFLKIEVCEIIFLEVYTHPHITVVAHWRYSINKSLHSPYQCQGDHDLTALTDLPPGLSAFLRSPPCSAMEIRQSDGYFLRSKRRRYSFPSPYSNRKRSSPGREETNSHPSSLRPYGQKHSAGFQSLPDWHLHPSVFQPICQWGIPQIDLFATSSSTQLTRFFAWGQASEAEAFDALMRIWDFELAYAFPPPLLPRVLSKMELSMGEFILITPFWRTQKWFPILEVRRPPLLLEIVVNLTTKVSRGFQEDPCFLFLRRVIPTHCRKLAQIIISI